MTGPRGALGDRPRMRIGADIGGTFTDVAAVDADGVLTIDTSQVALGPLPIALGQPGVLPPRVPHERACS